MANSADHAPSVEFIFKRMNLYKFEALVELLSLVLALISVRISFAAPGRMLWLLSVVSALSALKFAWALLLGGLPAIFRRSAATTMMLLFCVMMTANMCQFLLFIRLFVDHHSSDEQTVIDYIIVLAALLVFVNTAL
mmetsp:Transcript_94986/g.307274  ORF Transcript_94986/g.307274 Transcript_94986/m.307274 type:complete len:137 (-) Transcript_94986:637-1047(-)